MCEGSEATWAQELFPNPKHMSAPNLRGIATPQTNGGGRNWLLQGRKKELVCEDNWRCRQHRCGCRARGMTRKSHKSQPMSAAAVMSRVSGAAKRETQRQKR